MKTKTRISLIFRLLLVIVIIGSVPEILNALTQRDAARLRSRAQTYTHNRRDEAAAKIYLRLLESDFPTSSDRRNYIHALIRCGKQQEGIDYLRTRWEQPQTAADSTASGEIAILLAEAHLSLGEHDKAAQYWRWYEEQAQGNVERMGQLIQHFARMNQDEEALEHIEKWRRQLHRRELWGYEAGNILKRHQNFIGAFEEYRRELGRETGNDRALMHQIAGLPFPADSSGSFFESVRKWTRGNPEDPLVVKTMAGWLVKSGYLKEATPWYQRLDQLSDENGKEMLRFADVLIKEKAYEQALQILDSYLTNHPDTSPDRSILLKQVDLNTKLGRYSQAVTALESLIEQTRNPTLRDLMILKMGRIQMDYLQDRKSAVEWFRKVSGSEKTQVEATRGIVRASILENHPDSALTIIQDMLTRVKGNNSRQLLNHDRAELLFLAGQTGAASALLDSLLADGFDLADWDDHLLMLMLTRNNAGAPERMKQLGRADLLLMQSNYSEAGHLYLQLFRSFSDPFVMSHITRRLITIPEHDLPADSLQQLADYYLQNAGKTDNPINDEVLYLLSLRLDELGYQDLAAAGYDQLLIAVPGTIYGDRIRTRIRELENQ